jgi:hypothetical protein
MFKIVFCFGKKFFIRFEKILNWNYVFIIYNQIFYINYKNFRIKLFKIL